MSRDIKRRWLRMLAFATLVTASVILRPAHSRGSEIDPALNMLVGVGAKTGSYRSFVQLKGTVSDNSDAALAVGLRS